MYHTVVHFEIPASNIEDLKTFYAKLFGWKFQNFPGSTEYWLINTAPEGKGVNGGLFKRQKKEQTPVNYILVESVEKYSKKIEELGGKILVPKEEIPQVGFWAYAIDPEGNQFGIFESTPKQRPKPKTTRKKR